MIHYTLGFLFNQNLSKILLIHKLSPTWQAGQINGLGGKFETNETGYQCIAREVTEETSLVINPTYWQKIGEIRSPQSHVEVLTTVYLGSEADARSLEKEQIEWLAINNLPKNVMSNLSWLIPLCKDKIKNQEFEDFVIKYK